MADIAHEELDKEAHPHDRLDNFHERSESPNKIICNFSQ